MPSSLVTHIQSPSITQWREERIQCISQHVDMYVHSHVCIPLKINVIKKHVPSEASYSQSSSKLLTEVYGKNNQQPDKIT